MGSADAFSLLRHHRGMGAPIFVADDVMHELACPIADVSQHLEQCQQRANDALERGSWRALSPELIDDLRTSAAADSQRGGRRASRSDAPLCARVSDLARSASASVEPPSVCGAAAPLARAGCSVYTEMHDATSAAQA